MKTTGILNLQPYELIELSKLAKIMNNIPIVDTEGEEIFRVGSSGIGFNPDKTVTIEHNHGFAGRNKTLVKNPSYFSVLIADKQYPISFNDHDKRLFLLLSKEISVSLVPRYRFFDGDYMNICCLCEHEFFNCDKRQFICPECCESEKAVMLTSINDEINKLPKEEIIEEDENDNRVQSYVCLHTSDLREESKDKDINLLTIADFKTKSSKIFQEHSLIVYNDDELNTRILQNRYGSHGTVQYISKY